MLDAKALRRIFTLGHSQQNTLQVKYGSQQKVWSEPIVLSMHFWPYFTRTYKMVAAGKLSGSLNSISNWINALPRLLDFFRVSLFVWLWKRTSWSSGAWRKEFTLLEKELKDVTQLCVCANEFLSLWLASLRPTSILCLIMTCILFADFSYRWLFKEILVGRLLWLMGNKILWYFLIWGLDAQGTRMMIKTIFFSYMTVIIPLITIILVG